MTNSTTTANILLSIYYVPDSCAKGVPWITAFIPCDSPTEICVLVFCISHSWEDYMERLTHLPKITQYARAGGLDQESVLSTTSNEVVCPPALFVFLLRSYWVYIFNVALKTPTSKPAFFHASVMPILYQHYL